MRLPLSLCASLMALTLGPAVMAASGGVTFSQSAKSVETYDYVEIALNITAPDAANPFTGATLSGWFAKAGGSERVPVDGFCDSPDGSVFRLRFMPSSEGAYTYSVVYRQGGFEKRQEGTFEATPSKRRGPIRVDADYPWHFIWEGTKEHYFFNGTTSFWLMGWRDERIIQDAIERLHKLKINRMRVLLSGGTSTMYGEPVMTGDNFTLFLRPWLAQRPQSLDNPGINYTRFDTAYWQKYERMLRFARERDMIISVIQDINDGRIHPAAYSEDEQRYLRYAAARLGAFSNITWDLGDDMDGFRDEKWVHATGTLLMKWDQAHHLASSHPIHRAAQDRAFDVVRIHVDPGLVAAAACSDVGGARDSEKDGADHSPDQRGVRLRGSLSALGAGAAGRLGRNPAPDGLGYRHGRSVRNRGRERAPRSQHLARHRRGLGERARGRQYDHAQGLRPHGRFLDELRMVEDGTTR